MTREDFNCRIKILYVQEEVLTSSWTNFIVKINIRSNHVGKLCSTGSELHISILSRKKAVGVGFKLHLNNGLFQKSRRLESNSDTVSKAKGHLEILRRSICEHLLLSLVLCLVNASPGITIYFKTYLYFFFNKGRRKNLNGVIIRMIGKEDLF